jgi:4-hydroxy 2-oxovalerate aldolase
MEVHGDLMMPHMVEPAALAKQAAIMQDAGAQGIFVMDSAGALLPQQVTARTLAMRERLASSTEVGIHAHNNLGMAVANTVAAIEAGATLADACLAGLGAGAGNCQTEVLATVLDRLGFDHGLDIWRLQDIAEEVVRPLMATPPCIDRISLSLGFAGVASSLMLPATRAADSFAVDARDVITRLGALGAVSGQEDLVLAVAHDLAEAKAANA